MAPSIKSILLTCLSFSAIALSNPLHRRACPNTATARGCWGDYSIADDTHDVWPTTGVTREYWFVVKEVTLAPDGVSRKMLTINGTYPGPTIEADWGDNVVVHVTNELVANGTGIHFHGVRQFGTNFADGAISETECPISPGDSFTYRWRATQHGTGWYHSHYSLQYTDGLLGAIVVHGPKTANYDYDLGPILITDHYHTESAALAASALTNSLGLPPLANNGLINGKNTYGSGGSRFTTKFTYGKKHLLRLINTGSEVTFKFSIDNHKMKVVAMDWVPIVPYETDVLFIGVGQRYDVIVEADQLVRNYWMRARPMLTCLTINTNAFDVRGIVKYLNIDNSTPTTLSWNIVDACVDEPLSDTVPYHAHNVGASSISPTISANLLPDPLLPLALRWNVGSAVFHPPKDSPLAKQIIDGVLPSAIHTDFAPLDFSSISADATKWAYVVLQSLLPLAHPIHLHGHDFYVMGRGLGLFTETFDGHQLNKSNPPRRDTVNLPGSGWLALAFRLDNPGAWILHCHIAWHLHHGFALSVIEGTPAQIAAAWPAADQLEMNRVCTNWGASGLENRH